MKTSKLYLPSLLGQGLISSVLAGYQDQIPPLPQPNDISGTVSGCADAIMVHDDDGDGAIRQDEYLDFVNNVADLLCIPPRPILDLELQTVFVSIACLCQELEGNDITCCFGEQAGLYQQGASEVAGRTEEQQSYLRAACLLTQAVLGPEQCVIPLATLGPQAVMPPEEDSTDEFGFNGFDETDSPEATEPPMEADFESSVEDEEVPPPAIIEQGTRGFCDAAIAVQAGDNIVGSTIDAPLNEMIDCVGFFLEPVNASTLLYTLEGTGDGITIEVIASFDSFILDIYAGVDCESSTCFTGTFSRNSTTFLSELDATYYIALTPLYNDGGDFVLSITAGGEEPANSECNAAMPVEAFQIINGTTEFSKSYSGEECDINHTSPGVWYTLEGTDEFWLLAAAGFDTRLSLFDGEGCDALSCVASNDDSLLSLDLDDTGLFANSAIAQFLEEGQTYRVLVDGFQFKGGDFVLYTEAIALAENDDCSTAEPLQLDVLTSTDTVWASADESLPPCGLGANESAGVWYSVTGIGGPMKVTMEGYGFAAVVYEGSCGALDCVGVGGESSGAPIVFESVPGEEYFVYAYDAFVDTMISLIGGNFNLTVEEVERPPNDMCVDAIALEIGDSFVGDTTASTEETDIVSCGETSGLGYGGLWYKFTGTGETVLLGVNTTDGFDSQLNLYLGEDCDELDCVDGNDDNRAFGVDSALVINTVEGEQYYVLVHGYLSSRGPFEISLSIAIPPENPTCDTAIALETGDVMDGGTLFSEREDEFEDVFCGGTYIGNTSAAGVWYTVMGSGGTMEVALASDFYTQVTVFSGDSCETLECVDGEVSFDGLAVYWTSKAGTLYAIFVHGLYSDDRGEFEIVVQDVESPPNDACEDAYSIEVGDIVTGSTQYALPSNLTDCDVSGAMVEEPAVWYTILSGTDSSPIVEGEDVRSGISISVSNYTSAHRVSVFVGDDCGNLSCWTNAIGSEPFLDPLGEFPDDRAYVSWEAVPGETYYIAVSRTDDAFGGFPVAPLEFEMIVGAWAVAKKNDDV